MRMIKNIKLYRNKLRKPKISKERWKSKLGLSVRVIVRVRFTRDKSKELPGYKPTWAWAFGSYSHNPATPYNNGWMVEGFQGTIEVSHWGYLPRLKKKKKAPKVSASFKNKKSKK